MYLKLIQDKKKKKKKKKKANLKKWHDNFSENMYYNYYTIWLLQ